MGMPVENFPKLAAIEPGNFWFEARNHLIIGLINKFFPKAGSFMEIGCGTGFVLAAIAKSRPWQALRGSELHSEGLAFARARLAGADLVQMDARKIPAAPKFDVIGAFDVIEHIEEDEAVLASIRGALTQGGGVIITVPQHRWLWSKVDEVACHVRRYRAADLHGKLEQAGFKVVFSSSFTALLLLPMLLSRLRNRDVSGSEFSLSPLTNRLLRFVLDLEVKLTLAGVSWPAGGSRVVVAIAI